MGQQRRAFNREPADQRRSALIHATLALIGEAGFAAATVRAIAERANVTQGLIRHYFATKEDLIAAAFEHHMSELTEQSLFPAGAENLPAIERLRAVVKATLTAPVLQENAVTLWASFFSRVRTKPEIHQMHKQTYLQFREVLEEFISDAYTQVGRSLSADDIRSKAIACNAVIDGLWMEGGALPEAFSDGELEQIGLTSIGAILGLELDATGPAQ